MNYQLQHPPGCRCGCGFSGNIGSVSWTPRVPMLWGDGGGGGGTEVITATENIGVDLIIQAPGVTYWTVVTSITLPPGDWDISANFAIDVPLGSSDHFVAFSVISTDTTNPPGPGGDQWPAGWIYQDVPPDWQNLSFTVGTVRRLVTATTTVYLLGMMNSVSGTTVGQIGKGYGYLYARKAGAIGTINIGTGIGITDGSDARPGEVGECMQGWSPDWVPIPMAVAGAPEYPLLATIAQMTLSAGDWAVSGEVLWSVASPTQLPVVAQAWLSTTPNLSGANGYGAYVVLQNFETGAGALTPERWNLTTATPIYLVASVTALAAADLAVPVKGVAAVRAWRVR